MIHQCTANSVGNPNPLGNNNNEQQQKKKKRRNKKKKANKVIEENSSDSDSDLEDLAFIAPPSVAINKGKPKPSLGTYHENQLDDPVTVTIKQVMSKSNYSHERVASCVNRMWDTGLQYDSTEAVLAELQREDDKKVEEQDDYDEILDGKRRVGTNPPVPSLPPPVQVQVSQSSTKPKTEPTFAKPPAVPSISFGRHTISPVPPQPQVTPAPKPEPQPPQSLSARLELIASHDDITQALIALNSWSKITPNAPMSFFQHDCYAMEVILQRFCSQPSLIHESSVRTQLVDLLSSLLPPPSLKVTEGSVKSDHIQSFLSSFSNLLDQAARSTALKISTPLSGTTSVTASHTSRVSPLALRLGQSLRKIHQTYEKTRATFNESGSIFTIDEEIKNLSDTINKMQSSFSSSSAGGGSGGVGMKEKFQLRELIYEAFQLQIKKIEAIQKEKIKPTISDIHLPSTISYTQQDNLTLENAILLASGDSRRNIDALKLQASSSKNYYEKLFHDHQNRLIPYQNDFNKLQEQFHELETKKIKLLNEIEKINEEMFNIETKTKTIQNFLNELQIQHEKQINTLNSSHGHIVDAIEKDNQLTHLFNNLINLEHVMDEISMIGIDSLSSLSSTVHETIKTETIIDTFVNYTQIESKCIEFLTKRIILMKDKIIYSEKEVIEYKNLGMTNLANEISLSIERMKENISEDFNALQTLQNTVCELLTSLHTVVRNHSVVRAMPSHSLQEIVANLLSVGVTLRPELAPYNVPISPPGIPVPTQTQPSNTSLPPTAPKTNPPQASQPPKPSKTHPNVQAEEKTKSTEKPKQSEKKSADKVEKKPADKVEKKSAPIASEKKSNEKPQNEKKSKAPSTASSEPPVAASKSGKASTQAAPVPQQPSAAVKEIKPNNNVKETKPTAKPVAAPAPVEAPLPQRTNSRRKPTASTSDNPETPKKGPEPTPTSDVISPPGLSKTSETKGWSGWATVPSNKRTGSLAQIQAEQASAKKAQEVQPVPLPSVAEFPALNQTIDQTVPKPVVETPSNDVTSSDGKEDEVDPDNPDAKSDISVRGDADDLDDDDDLDSKSNSVKEIIEESNPDSPVFPSLVPEEASVTSTTLEDIPVSTVSASLEESNHDNDNDNNAPQEETTVEVTTKEVEGEEEDVVTSSKFDY